jgi:hypothetical protein
MTASVADAEIPFWVVDLITRHGLTPPGRGMRKQSFRIGQRCRSHAKWIEAIEPASKEMWESSFFAD